MRIRQFVPALTIARWETVKTLRMALMRKDRKLFIILRSLLVSLLCLWNISLPCAAGDVDESVEDAEKSFFDRAFGMAFLPFALYTPETRLGGGIGGVYTFRFGGDEESRPSSISLSLKYTQNEQYVIDLTPDLHIRDEYRLKSQIIYQKFPFRFYGIGHDTSSDIWQNYTPREFGIRGFFQKKVFADLNLGVQYDFQSVDIIEVEKNPDLPAGLESGQVIGGEGGTASGFGLLVNWDGRDRLFSATRGGFYQLSFMTYREAWGSDHNFTRYILDMRRYFPVFSSHVLGIQTLLDFSIGDPPFQKLALLGGMFMMRGYYQGRYRDKNLMALQAEYRITPVWWRVGLVGFVSVGDVSDSVDDFHIGDLKTAVGLGGRFQFNRGEGVNLRADVAVGEGQVQYYLTMFEAF